MKLFRKDFQKVRFQLSHETAKGMHLVNGSLEDMMDTLMMERRCLQCQMEQGKV